jgi:hypothetical protein
MKRGTWWVLTTLSLLVGTVALLFLSAWLN